MCRQDIIRESTRKEFEDAKHLRDSEEVRSNFDSSILCHIGAISFLLFSSSA